MGRLAVTNPKAPMANALCDLMEQLWEGHARGSPALSGPPSPPAAPPPASPAGKLCSLRYLISGHTEDLVLSGLCVARRPPSCQAQQIAQAVLSLLSVLFVLQLGRPDKDSLR